MWLILYENLIMSKNVQYQMQDISKKVIIFGIGEFAEIIHLYLSESKEFNVVGFTVHKEFLTSDKFQNLPVIPFETISDIFPTGDFYMFVALGYTDNNKKRERIFNQVKNKGYTCISYAHPSNIISKNFKFGENCFIFENNIIQPYVELGNNVIIWSNNIISHHTIIKDNCFIVSNVAIAGHVNLGKNCFLGISSTVRNGISIGDECVIGAGVVILDNTGNNEVYVTQEAIKLDISSNDLKKL